MELFNYLKHTYSETSKNIRDVLASDQVWLIPGSNELGFAVLPAGYCPGLIKGNPNYNDRIVFEEIGVATIFWEKGKNSDKQDGFYFNDYNYYNRGVPVIFDLHIVLNALNSIRCIKD